MTNRRDFLWSLGGGLGGIALTQLFAEQGLLGDAPKHSEACRLAFNFQQIMFVP